MENIFEQEIASRVEYELEQGLLKVPRPNGYSGRGVFNVSSVREIGPYFEFFDSDLEGLDKEARHSIEYAVEGFNCFQRHLFGDDLEDLLLEDPSTIPKLVFQVPLKNQDLDVPKLDGFNYDDRVFVKPMKSGGYEYGVEISASFGGDTQTHNLVKRYPFQFMLGKKRFYSLDDEEGLVVFRRPVVLNLCQGENVTRVSRFADLAYKVFLHQLEPVTTLKIDEGIDTLYEQWSKKESSDSQKGKEFSNVCLEALVGEELVAKLTILDWLLNTKNQTRFDNDDIMSWQGINGGLEDEGSKDIKSYQRFVNLQNRDVLKGLEQVREVGFDEFIDYYSGPDWDFKKFLDGSWKKDFD